MRTKARTDNNQKTIVARLRAAGFHVVCTHQAGAGFPDLIVANKKNTWLVEIKSPGGKLTPAQLKFHKQWNAAARPIIIAHNFDDLLQELNENS